MERQHAVALTSVLLATVFAHNMLDAKPSLFIVASVTTFGPSLICSRIPGLSPEQMRICEEHPTLINCIREGYQNGAKECKNQFRNNRWNCTLLKQTSDFDNFAIPGTKEAAFTQAIISAGVVYTITKACSMGNLSECNCDREKWGTNSNKGWMWGGCSVDTEYGMGLAKRFVNARHNTHDAIFLMNKHNNKAGRQALKESLEIECHCHGTSGSCSIRTCWQALPTLRKVGLLLKQRYEHSVLVRAKKVLSPYGKRDAFLTLSSNDRKKPSQRDLVHLESPPNYCDRNEGKRIPGTIDRECNTTSTGEDGCELMCCGRGYNTHEKVHKWKCNCKFHWCCYVKCKNCKERREMFRCK